MSVLFSCGSNDNIEKTTDNNQTKIEITKSEKKIEEFTSHERLAIQCQK